MTRHIYPAEWYDDRWDDSKESHRNGRHLLTAELEAERRPRKPSTFLRVVAYVTGWCALLGLTVYALSHAGF